MHLIRPYSTCQLEPWDFPALHPATRSAAAPQFPVNFVAGSEGVPGWSERMQQLQAAFTQVRRWCFPTWLLYCLMFRARSSAVWAHP